MATLWVTWGKGKYAKQWYRLCIDTANRENPGWKPLLPGSLPRVAKECEVPGLPRFWESMVKEVRKGRMGVGKWGDSVLSSCVTPKEGHVKARWGGTMF